MHHFPYKGGVLHAEDVSLARLAAEVGTPFYCYSTATLRAALPRAGRGLRRARRAHLLCRQGQLQPGRARAPWRGSAPAWTSSPRASCGARWRPACRPTRSSSPASARRARRWRTRSSEGILGFNVESEPELRGAERGGGEPRPHARASPARQPGRRCQDARQDLHRQGGEQVRHSVSTTRRSSTRKARRLPGIAVAGIHMHIGSQITDLAPFRDAFRADARAGASSCARDGHTHRASRHRRRPRRALSASATTMPPLAVEPTRPWSRRRSAISASRSCWSRGA